MEQNEILEKVLATSDRYLGLNLIEEKNEDNILKSKLVPVGTVVKVIKAAGVAENTVQILCKALRRYTLAKKEKKGDNFTWEVDYKHPEKEMITDTSRAYGHTIRTAAKELLKEKPAYSRLFLRLWISPGSCLHIRLRTGADFRLFFSFQKNVLPAQH